MKDKLTNYGLLILAVLVGYVIAKYTVKPEIKEVKVYVKDTETKKDVKKEITRVKSPDGTVKTITKIDSKTDFKERTTDSAWYETKYKELPKWKVGVLLGFDGNQNKTKGLLIQHQFIGTMDLGAYYLDNKNMGFIIQVGF